MASTNNLPSDLPGIVTQMYARKQLVKPLFDNALVKYGQPGVIPQGMGKVIHFNRWNDFPLATKMANEASVPAAGESMGTSEFICQLDNFSAFVNIPVYGAEQVVLNQIDAAYELLTRQLERTVNHYLLSDLIIGDVTGSNSYTPFTAMYANNVNSFADTAAPITIKDIGRAIIALEQAHAPKPYHVFLDPWTKSDLMTADKDFREFMHAQRVSVFEKGEIQEWMGGQFHDQAEPWRENVEGTYAASGQVVTCVVCSDMGYGRVQLSGRTGIKPKFHVQNISVNGAVMSAGYFLPFKGIALKSDWGIALKGKTINPSIASISA